MGSRGHDSYGALEFSGTTYVLRLFLYTSALLLSGGFKVQTHNGVVGQLGLNYVILQEDSAVMLVGWGKIWLREI